MVPKPLTQKGRKRATDGARNKINFNQTTRVFDKTGEITSPNSSPGKQRTHARCNNTLKSGENLVHGGFPAQ